MKRKLVLAAAGLMSMASFSAVTSGTASAAVRRGCDPVGTFCMYGARPFIVSQTTDAYTRVSPWNSPRYVRNRTTDRTAYLQSGLVSPAIYPPIGQKVRPGGRNAPLVKVRNKVSVIRLIPDSVRVPRG